MNEVDAQKARWAELHAARFRQFAKDLNVPPLSDFPQAGVDFRRDISERLIRFADQVDGYRDEILQRGGR